MVNYPVIIKDSVFFLPKCQIIEVLDKKKYISKGGEDSGETWTPRETFFSSVIMGP